MRKTSLKAQRVAASVLVAFGAISLATWALQANWLDWAYAGGGETLFNSSLMFSLCGIGLMFSPHALRRKTATVFALAVGAIASFVLLEHLFGFGIDIDIVRIPTSPTLSAPHPGRVPANTCLVFVLAALSLWLGFKEEKSLFQRRLLVCAISISLLVSLSSLAIYFLNLGAFYEIANINRMAVPTAAFLTVLAAGLWFLAQGSLAVGEAFEAASAWRIGVRSLIIMSLAAASTAIAGFAIVRESVESTAKSHILTTARLNASNLAVTLDQRLRFAKMVASRPAIVDSFDTLQVNPGDRAATERLRSLGDSFLPAGLSNVRFESASGELLIQSGFAAGDAALSNIPILREDRRAFLLWRSGYILSSTEIVSVNGKPVGRVTIEQPLPTFDLLIQETQRSNPHSELLICGRIANDAVCGPSRFSSTQRRIPLVKESGRANIPFDPASLTTPSVYQAKDYRNVQVFAGYAPLVGFGLATVHKVDAVSLYSPLRDRISDLFIIVIGLVVVGGLLSFAQVQPILNSLIREQLRNRVILANSNDAFVAIDAKRRVTQWNHKAIEMFGWTAAEAIGADAAELILPKARADQRTGIQRFIDGRSGDQLNVHIEVIAKRKDESTFSTELSITGYKVGNTYVVNAFFRDITQRKASELALQTQERFVRTVTDNIPALVAYVDYEQRYRFANAALATLLNVEPDEIIGKRVQEVGGERIYLAISNEIKGALRGERHHFERVLRLGGREVHLLIDLIPDMAAAGSVPGFYITAVDITDRKQAEIRQAASEQRLRQITDNLPSIIAHIDTQERYQFANQQVKRVFGMDPSELLGRTMRDVRGEQVYAQIEPYVRRVLAGESVTFEGNRHGSTGREYAFQSNFIPEFDKAGSVVGFYAMTFDITERKNSEIRQAENEKRLRLITDNLPVLISYIDKDYRFMFGNATFKDWLGIDPQDYLGKPIESVIGGTQYEQRHEHIANALAGQTVRFDVGSQTDGKMRYLQTIYVPDITEEGETKGIYTLSMDVTSLKEIELQLSALARIDSLTGLPNRRQFDERVAEAISRSQRTGQAMGLLFLDIDRFKSINDTLGHACGDEVLVEFGARLKKSVRKTDTVARLAGDEFVIILDGVKEGNEPELIAQAIINVVRHPVRVADHELLITTSIGIAMLQAADTTVDTILARADEALYTAKAAGRDQFARWTLVEKSADVDLSNTEKDQNTWLKA